jgi:hypothetical protein
MTGISPFFANYKYYFFYVKRPTRIGTDIRTDKDINKKN